MNEERFREVLKEELEPIQTTLTRHDHAIYGNGSPGIRERISVLEAKGKTSAALWWTFGGCAVTALITAAVTKFVG